MSSLLGPGIEASFFCRKTGVRRPTVPLASAPWRSGRRTGSVREGLVRGTVVGDGRGPLAVLGPRTPEKKQKRSPLVKDTRGTDPSIVPDLSTPL